jgi:hypothetical protein
MPVTLRDSRGFRRVNSVVGAEAIKSEPARRPVRKTVKND